jgi:hypothetical protein
MKLIIIKNLNYLSNALSLAFTYFKTKRKKTINLIIKKKIYIICSINFFKLSINRIKYLRILTVVSLFFLTKFLFFDNVSLMFNKDLIELSKIIILFIENNLNNLLDFFSFIISDCNLLQNENTVLLLEKKELSYPVEISQDILHYKPLENVSVESQHYPENTIIIKSQEEEKVKKEADKTKTNAL